MTRGFAILFAATISAGLLVGCGPDTGGRVGIEGHVTHQGRPLENGSIEFVAEDGSQMAGATISQGQYTVPATAGLKPGKFIVRVSATPPGPVVEEEAAGDSSAVPVRKELIPPEFNVDSKVIAEIENTSTNQFNLEIP